MAVALRGAGQLQDAARLFGAGDGLLASIGSTQWPTNITEVQPAHADTRRELGQDTFARAWSEGRAMGLDGALRFASPASERTVVGAVRASDPKTGSRM